jgi:predicted nucleotidyltransferase
MDTLRLAEVAARHRVTLLLQHGSTVSGRVHARSDLDIAALFEADDVSLADVVELTADLQGLNPGREVDVAVLNHADPLLLKLIIEKCRLLYGSPRRLAELGMYAYRRYQDHRRFLALEQSYVTRALQRMGAG